MLKVSCRLLVITVFALAAPVYSEVHAAGSAVHVDQLGYRVKGSKSAAVANYEGQYKVIDEATNSVVRTGRTKPGTAYDDASGDSVSWADLTPLTNIGRYRIELSDSTVSAPFEISDSRYAGLRDALVKALYFQRCGTALDEEYAGLWKHKACHTADGKLYENLKQKLDVDGGWHDAGDYGKYVVPGAVSVGHLLLAYEHIPEVFKDNTGIPESGNSIPDILDEARWELEWMLKMQRPDGGVYHKATPYGFPGFIMPESDRQDIIISPVSGAATADLAAVNAMAYTAFKDIDPEFARKLLDSAILAWSWMMKNPEPSGFTNPKGISSGEYGDGNLHDEWLWAGVSLYRATGAKEYRDAVLNMYVEWADVNPAAFGWQGVGGFASVELLFMKDADPRLVKLIKDAFIEGADNLMDIAQMDGYHIPLTSNDYGWGSTMGLMTKAMHLLFTSKLRNKPLYEEQALLCLQWLLGRNPMDVCYVTGFGSRPIRSPHHRPSQADRIKDPVPGLVSGGPNKWRQDPAAEKYIEEGTAPAKSFIDNWESYSTNEIAIYWNSPAVFVAAWFSR